MESKDGVREAPTEENKGKTPKQWLLQGDTVWWQATGRHRWEQEHKEGGIRGMGADPKYPTTILQDI